MNKNLLLVSSIAMLGMLAACGHQESSTDNSSVYNSSSQLSSNEEHKYSETYTYDEEYHWKKCTVNGHSDVSEKAKHNFDAGQETKPATETETGIFTYTCLTCSYKKEDILPLIEHVHTFDTEHWKSNETHHWHEATCVHTDEKDSYGEHNFSTEPIIDQEATYTQDGLQHYTCLTCAYEKSETIPMLEKKDSQITLAISEDELKGTYNGKSISTFINTNSFNWSAGIKTITYQKAGDSTWYSAQNAPKDVGTYTVKASIVEGEDHKAASLEVSFVLEQRELGKGLNLDKVYDGTTTKTISNIKDEKTDCLVDYGAIDGDDINVNVDYEKSYVGASASLSKGNITISGDDATNYKLVLDKDTYKISTKRTLTIPSSYNNGKFTRSALDRQYEAIYHFTEEDGVLPGDEVYLYDDNDLNAGNEMKKIGTHEFTYEHLWISNSNYTFDTPEEWNDITLSLTVLNDETFRFVQSTIVYMEGTNIRCTGYVAAGQVSVGDTVYFSHCSKPAQVEKIEDSNGNSIQKAGRYEYDSVKLYVTSSDVTVLFNTIHKGGTSISIWGDEESTKIIPQFRTTIKNLSATEYNLYKTPYLYFVPYLNVYASGSNSFEDLAGKGIYVTSAEIINIIGSDNKPISSIPANGEAEVVFEFKMGRAYPIKAGDEFVSFLASGGGKANLRGVVTSVHMHVDKYYKTGYCDEELDGGCGWEVERGTFAVSEDGKTYTFSSSEGTGLTGVNTGQYAFYEITLPQGKLFEFSILNEDGEDISNLNYHALYNTDGTVRNMESRMVILSESKFRKYTGYTGPDKLIIAIHPDLPLFNFSMTFTQIYSE